MQKETSNSGVELRLNKSNGYLDVKNAIDNFVKHAVKWIPLTEGAKSDLLHIQTLCNKFPQEFEIEVLRDKYNKTHECNHEFKEYIPHGCTPYHSIYKVKCLICGKDLGDYKE